MGRVVTDWQNTWRKPIVKPKLEQYVNPELAKRIYFPELEWETFAILDYVDLVMESGDGHKPLFLKQMRDVPVHKALLKSIEKQGLLHPILAQHNWFPMIGLQRIRAAMCLGENFCKEHTITVARIKHPVWDVIGVWPDRDNVEDFLAMYFECLSHVFKSIYNTQSVDSTGRSTRSYEYRMPDEELDYIPDPLADWISSRSV